MATVIRELLIRISTMGEQVVSGAFRKVTGDVNTNVEAIEGARTAYLFLAFGLLATGGMLKRWGNQLKSVTDNMVGSFRSLEHQAAITSSILGGMGKHQKTLATEMKRLGVLTEFTATQSGEAMQQLAMAGFNVNEVMGATEATLRLATIGLMDVSEAANIAAGVYRGFNYEAEDTVEVSEQLYGVVSQLGFAITHSAMTANDLGDALKFVAASASSVGWALEDATIGLMVAADNMVRAGIAGRALRMSLIKLSKLVGATTAGFSNANEVLEQFGLEFVDAEGNLKGFVDIVIELQEGLKDLTPLERQAALAALFGTRAVTFWSAAMGEATEELRDRELGLLTAAAKEAIFNKTGREGTQVLKDWREEIGSGESAMNFLINTMGFGEKAAEDINAVIGYSEDTFKSWNEIVEDASTTIAIVDERLGTLTGSIILFESSLDALYATFGESIGPVMQKWYDLLKIIADLMSKLPGWIRAPIGLLILLGGVFMSMAGSVLTTVGSLAMLMAAMVMIEGQSLKNLTIGELLIHSFRRLGRAALDATKWLFWMAVRGLGMVLFYAGPLVLAILAIQHAWVKFGPIGAAVVTALSLIGLWLWYTKVRIWLMAKGLLGMSAATAKASAANYTYTGSLVGVSGAVSTNTVVETTNRVAIMGSTVAKRIGALANWVYAGATTVATGVTWAFSAALGFLSIMARTAYTALGPLLLILLAVSAVVGLFIGSIVASGKEADKGWGHSTVPDAFESGAMNIKGTITGLDDDLAALGMFSMAPKIPGINGPVTAGGGGRPVVIASSASITYEGGITLGGDEATLRKFKKMQEEAVEIAMKKTLRETEKEIQRGVMW